MITDEAYAARTTEPAPTAPEVWRAHPAYPFDVSTHGRVRSHRTRQLVGWDVAQRRAGMPGRYRAVTVGQGPGEKSYRVHALVLETFVGPRPHDHEGDHIDFDGFNNRLDNLRWLPRADNQARKRRRVPAGA